MLNVTTRDNKNRKKESLAKNKKTRKFPIYQDTGEISERENERNGFRDFYLSLRGVESEREILTSVKIEKTHRKKEKQKEIISYR